MYAHVDYNTRFHIDLGWWEGHGRNLGRFLAEMLGEQEADEAGGEPLDYVDPVTAEVYKLDPLWARVLTDKAHRPDYITPATPLTNAVLRALIENMNRPMTVTQLHRRISRGNPLTLLRLMQTARLQYGIVPVQEA